MPAARDAMERLVERMETLDGLYRRGIVTDDLLQKQIKSLLSSRDASSVFREYIQADKKAIKILSRIEDPTGWRELFTKNRDQREAVFYTALENIMETDTDRKQRILHMLQLACLPFYSGFLPLDTRKKKAASEVKPSRVSVLD
jgi:hypothetical protein